MTPTRFRPGAIRAQPPDPGSCLYLSKRRRFGPARVSLPFGKQKPFFKAAQIPGHDRQGFIRAIFIGP